MKSIILLLVQSNVGSNLNNYALLFFRITVATELLLAHGLKKIGLGVQMAEIVPNPLGLPELLNQSFAIGANIIMPLFIILGLFTRIATLPILAVTLTGFFVLHAHDAIAIRDIPFIYSVCFLFILMTGAGRYSLDFLFFNQKCKLSNVSY